jgi:hypothetical protein
MKYRLYIVFLLIISLSLTLSTPSFAKTNEELIKKAIRYKIQGRLEKALDLYEETITNDGLALSIQNDGLMNLLIKKYEKLSKKGDINLIYKLADYCDMNGDTDKAIKYFKKVIKSDNKELASLSKERIKSLKTEGELYDKFVQENIEKDKEEEQIVMNNQRYVRNNYNQEENSSSNENSQETDELKNKIAEAEKEVAEAESKMNKNRRDREGRGSVRSWRLKDSDSNKDKYNNSFARRYRTSKKEYNEKTENLNKLKSQLDSLQK